MRLLFLFVISTCSLLAFNIHISDSTITNGRTALLEFKKELHVEYEKIAVGKKTYKISTNPLDTTRAYCLLPISYYEKPSDKKVKIFYKENNEQKSNILFFHVQDGKYKKETIHVQKSKVKLNKKDKKRAAKEYAEAMKIYNKTNSKSYLTQNFIVPLDTKITSDFSWDSNVLKCSSSF